MLTQNAQEFEICDLLGKSGVQTGSPHFEEAASQARCAHRDGALLKQCAAIRAQRRHSLSLHLFSLSSS